MTYTPKEIKDGVIDELYWDGRVDASQIAVAVDHRVVTLTGSVPSLAAREAIEADAMNVPGVRAVHNEVVVEVRTGQAGPVDSEIASSVSNLLRLNRGIEAHEVDVGVHEGLVTLKGTVDTLWKKARAREVASEVPGVKEVRNELVVTPTEAYEDRKIAAAVVRSLQRVPGLPVEDLDVSVEDGEVSISGSVADAAHMLAMRKALEKTRGVRATHYRVEVESELVES